MGLMQHRKGAIFMSDNLSKNTDRHTHTHIIQGGSNMTGTDLYVNKPHCAAAVRP